MIAIRVAVLLSFSLSAQASAQARAEEAKTPEIRTAGTAQRTVRPDLATVTLQFSAEGATPKETSGVQFTATDVSAAQEEALREATVRARRQAEVIAAAGGMQLGAVLSLSTQASYMDDYRSYSVGSLSISGATADGSVPTVVVQPSVPVSVTVYGRWALVARP
jgi:uncharacterized protein YggE